MKITTIDIPLSLYKIDVVIEGTIEQCYNLAKKRYGIDERPLSLNECALFFPAEESELKGERRFYIALEKHPKKQTHILVHELWHLMWQISGEITDFKLSQESNKWAANMIEKLYKDIMSATYQTIDYSKGD